MKRIAPVGVVLALLIGVSPPATAATLFSVDRASSFVNITDQQGDPYCDLTNCGVSARLAFDSDFQFSVDSGETYGFDFIEWTGAGTGGLLYEVEAFLSFSEPVEASTGSGGGGFGVVLLGAIFLGSVFWQDVPNIVSLASGSQFIVDFEQGITLLAGSTVVSSASIEGIETLHAPLPPALPLFAAALGLVGLIVRRGRRAAAGNPAQA